MRIYVGNVPYAATEADLEELFEQHGSVESVVIIRDRYTRNSKGYGFVVVEDQAEAEKAMEALDGQKMMGRPLNVNQARPRDERSRSRDQRTGGQPTNQYRQPPRKSQTRHQQSGSTSDTGGEFHNPYTFVPTPPRGQAIESGGFAGDFNPLKHPCGREYNLDHATLKDDLWTGHIPIKLTAATPLVLLKTDGTREDESDDPYDVHSRIPESSLRGMLRSAYETVTNSRYSSFRNNDRLAYRMETDKAAELIPAIVKNEKICLYPGSSKVTFEGPKGKSNKPQPYAAMLTMYEDYELKTIIDTGYTPKTGDKVWAEILLCQHEVSPKYSTDWKKDFLFWKVIKVWNREKGSTKPKYTGKSIYRTSRPQTDRQYRQSHYTPLDPEDRKMVKGHVMITNRNMGNKHDERIFFNPHSEEFEVTEDLKESWRMRIQSYRDAHSNSDIFKRKGAIDEPWKYLGKQPGKTAWSPHQYQDNSHRDVWQSDRHGRATRHDALELKDGDMAYARCDIDKKTGDIKSIKELFPVMISRELYKCSPKELLAKSLQPAEKLNDLSSADRLFGWTPQGESSDNGYKSRIRVVCDEVEPTDPLETFQNGPLPLTILGTPKPEQGRFYVAKDAEGNPQDDGILKPNSGYAAGKGLRGRKHFWHHKDLEAENDADYWNTSGKNRLREYIYSGDEPSQQNRSINGWIKPGTTFTASLYVQHLQPAEVGALLWLLTRQDGHYFRLGYGKPLGFGSVKIEIDTECLPLGMGKDWKKYYEDLNACPPATMDKTIRDECIQEFKDSMVDAYVLKEENPVEDDNSNKRSLSNLSMADQLKGTLEQTSQGKAMLDRTQFDKLPFIEGFLQVLQGPNTDNPRIHYPRKNRTPHPDGKNFEWFVDNDHQRFGKKLALPKVTAKRGLPYKAKD